MVTNAKGFASTRAHSEDAAAPLTDVVVQTRQIDQPAWAALPISLLASENLFSDTCVY
jgi:hypothetical protein